MCEMLVVRAVKMSRNRKDQFGRANNIPNPFFDSYLRNCLPKISTMQMRRDCTIVRPQMILFVLNTNQ